MKIIIDNSLVLEDYPIDGGDSILIIQELKEILEKFSVFHTLTFSSDLVNIEIFEQKITLDEINMNSLLNIIGDFWPIELTSGMEKFVSSLAIRTALINVSSLPRPNFLAIDEGFGVLDSDNLNSMFNLFDYLKTQFSFMLVISHIDSMRDVVDKLIEITKTKKDEPKLTFRYIKKVFENIEVSDEAFSSIGIVLKKESPQLITKFIQNCTK
jgi:ABC-type lipoprotein export system ATPase subunit